MCLALRSGNLTECLILMYSQERNVLSHQKYSSATSPVKKSCRTTQFTELQKSQRILKTNCETRRDKRNWDWEFIYGLNQQTYVNHTHLLGDVTNHQILDFFIIVENNLLHHILQVTLHEFCQCKFWLN